MKKLNRFTFLIITVLLLLSCRGNKVRYTFIPESTKDDVKSDVNNLKLLVHLYNEKNVIKKVTIQGENGQILYSNKGVIKDGMEFKEIDIPKSNKYLNVYYNSKKNTIDVKRNYNYLYIEFRGSDLLEIVYSIKKPAFT